MDSDELELLERRLADGVRDRVEKTLKFRYGAFLGIALSVAGFFGWDLIEGVREEADQKVQKLTEQLAAAEGAVEDLDKRIKTFAEQLPTIRAEFNAMDADLKAFADTYQSIEADTQKLQAVVEATQRAQDNFIQEQTNIIARKFGETLDLYDNETAAFYEAIREFSSARGYAQLQVFATVQLAINRAANKRVLHSRDLFDEAERVARTISTERFLQVLIERAKTESDRGMAKQAIFTLGRAVKALDDSSDGTKGQVYLEYANTYFYEGEQGKAVDHYHKAADHFDAAEEFEQVASIYQTIGSIYGRAREADATSAAKARDAFERAIEVAGYIEDRLILYRAHESLARVLDAADAPVEARHHICQAASYAEGQPVFRSKAAVIRQFANYDAASFEEFCQ